MLPPPPTTTHTHTPPFFVSSCSFADIWDKEDTWQRDKKVLGAEQRLISVTGAAAIREHKIVKGKYADDIFSTSSGDADLVAMRSHIDGKFRQTFKSGVDAYLNGDWPKAKEYLEDCLTQTPHKVRYRTQRLCELALLVAACKASPRPIEVPVGTRSNRPLAVSRMTYLPRCLACAQRVKTP